MQSTELRGSQHIFHWSNWFDFILLINLRLKANPIKHDCIIGTHSTRFKVALVPSRLTPLYSDWLPLFRGPRKKLVLGSKLGGLKHLSSAGEGGAKHWAEAFFTEVTDFIDHSQLLEPVSIEGFHVTLYQANFASHPTRDHHVGFHLHGWV